MPKGTKGVTPSQLDEPTFILIRKMQTALEGEANDTILAACTYITANAVAILAHDRADAGRLLKDCARDQRKLLDGVWDRVRAELERRKLL